MELVDSRAVSRMDNWFFAMIIAWALVKSSYRIRVGCSNALHEGSLQPFRALSFESSGASMPKGPCSP